VGPKALYRMGEALADTVIKRQLSPGIQ
jgi:hypothetical protein